MANKTSFNSGRTLDAATENIEILTGARGNKLDKAITLRELGELGLANLVKVGSSYKASVGSSSSDSNASSNVEWPSSPENVSASGAFNVILVQWDQPRYKGHQYAEIWRAEEDNLSKAVWIGATAAVIYPDPIGGDAKAYYWVRFVNSNGDKGAFNSQSGIYAETSVDVAQLLEALTEKITADQLTQDLLTPISQINSINIGLLQTNQILENARSELQTAIDQANTDRISGDNGLSNSILSLSTTVTDNNTAATTRMNSIESAYKAADTALTSSVSDLTKTVTDNNTAATTRMNSIESAYKAADTTTNSSLITLMQTVSNNYAALSQSIASLDSAYKSADTTISSAISSEASTRASADTALSNTISSVSAVANAKNKTFFQTTAPINGMSAGDLWFDTDDNNTCYRYSGSAWLTTSDPRIASSAAAIITEQTARANGDSANATAISNLTTTVTNNYNTLNSAISSEVSARTSANATMATDITTVTATANSARSELDKTAQFYVTASGAGGGTSSVVNALTNATVKTGGRSWNVVLLNSSTYAVISTTTYDVYASATTAQTMADALNALASSSCLAIIFTYDEPATNLTSNLKAALMRFGASQAALDLIIYRSAYILVGIPGIGASAGDEYLESLNGGHVEKLVEFVNGRMSGHSTGYSAAVQVAASAIATTNAVYSAQWSVKTTVGALTGGVGFINDGTKTRFTVAAQQFAIVDSTLGENKFVPFVVSGGKVVMDNAFIDTAYIQSLAAAQITAEKINSLNLTSVNISGGTLTLGSGNNIMMANGGTLGFGKGGANSGWGYSWHTIIYADGSIYTDRLYASNGTFTGAVNATSGTFNNVTIAETCDVKGTVYADKIIGDVLRVWIPTVGSSSSTALRYGGSYSLDPYNKKRRISRTSVDWSVIQLVTYEGVTVKSIGDSTPTVTIPANATGLYLYIASTAGYQAPLLIYI